MAETERFPTPIGPWRFSAHGVAGQLILQDDGNGNLSGMINGSQQVIGLWDDSAQKVSFLCIVDPTNLASIQVYTGYLSSQVQGIDFIEYSLVGSYQAFSGSDVTPQRNTFGWTASGGRPA